jgi:hypothetical protein
MNPITVRHLVAIGMVMCIAHATRARAADPAPVRHRVLLCEYSQAAHRLLELSPDGKITWEHKVPAVAVCFVPLAGGHVLYADFGKPNRVREVDRDQKVVWEYQPTCEQVVCLDRLPNGNTLLAEEGPCRAVEIDVKGRIVSAVPLTTSQKVAHNQLRCLHRLEGAHLLAAHEGDGVVREYDATGKIVWEYPGLKDVFEALRLPSGNTLIGCGTQRRIIEVTPDKQIVWELTDKDRPDLKLAWITSLQVLKNGNLVVANFLRGHEGAGVHAFEVTHDKDKRIVWAYADHNTVKSLTMLRVLDDDK